MMDLFEDLLSSAAQKILGTYQLQWQGEDFDLTPGWPRMPMHEAVKQYCGLDFMAISWSMPMPNPPVGGIPYSSAVRKSSSIIPASSSPLSRNSTCFWNRWR